jgi:alanine adding enzyme
MTLKILSRDDYQQITLSFKERSFMQSVEMADLLEKRGFDITFLGLEADTARKTCSNMVMPETL